jgi:hypothetical protein
MTELKKNRREIVKGDNSWFLAVGNKKIRSTIVQTHNTTSEERKSVNSIAQRPQGPFYLFKALGIGLIELN